MKALIVEHGMSRAALAAARGLAAGGWKVGLASAREKPLAGASRAVQECHWTPPAASDPDGCAARVAEIAAAGAYDVVFGADDAEVVMLAERRDQNPAAVPYPDAAAVARALDKVALSEAAAAAGIATPVTAESPDGIPAPLIVKGREHAAGGASRHDASVEATRELAIARGEQIEAEGGRPMFQEMVGGVLMALVCLMGGEAELVGVVQQQAELTLPAAAGVTVRGRTVPVDQRLLTRAVALLRELRWTGIAELQFIQPPGGEPRLIDLNGRFYGSLGLSLAAGVNMPAAWASEAVGRRPAPLPAAREGVRYQWLEGDLRRAREAGGRGLLRDVGGCLLYAPGAAHSIWQLTDPGPTLRLGGIFARRARGGER